MDINEESPELFSPYGLIDVVNEYATSVADELSSNYKPDRIIHVHQMEKITENIGNTKTYKI